MLVFHQDPLAPLGNRKRVLWQSDSIKAVALVLPLMKCFLTADFLFPIMPAWSKEAVSQMNIVSWCWHGDKPAFLFPDSSNLPHLNMAWLGEERDGRKLHCWYKGNLGYRSRSVSLEVSKTKSFFFSKNLHASFMIIFWMQVSSTCCFPSSRMSLWYYNYRYTKLKIQMGFDLRLKQE